MCKNAVATAGSVMKAIEPTLLNFLTAIGVLNAATGQTVKLAFDTALGAVESWVPGTPVQDVIQAVNDFDTVFNALPFPIEYKVLANVITAGITAVLGIIQANSPAPVALVE